MTGKYEFHLCQPAAGPSGTPSCGACCGIYNYLGHSRELVTSVMDLQTRAMQSWDGTDADIERIREEVERSRPPTRFGVIYNCPFSGFINEERTRVGCLLHPMRLGRDLRDYCRYGHRTCGEAKCTSYTYLDEGEAAAVIAAAPDWYIYGLAINDIDLVKDFFDLCEMRRYGTIDPWRVVREPALRSIFAEYLALKENWPFETDPGRFGKYWFEGREYHIYFIEYRKLGVEPPKMDRILTALGSVIETREDLERAMVMVQDKIDRLVAAY